MTAARLIPILLLLSLVRTLAASPADTLHVGQGKAYGQVKAAVAAAPTGAVIMVYPGVYIENEIFITRPCRLTGIDHPTIDANFKNDAFVIKADSVTISGFHIRNVATNYVRDLSAIHVESARHFTIENNRLENTFFGIYLQKSANGRVAGNTMTGRAVNEASSGNAIHLWYCKDIDLADNIAEKHRDGIYLEFSDSIRITNNTSKDNLRYGLHFMFSHHNTYLGNTFRSNGAGVAVMFSAGITMKNNLFVDNWGSASYGMLLKEIKDSEISHNVFSGNTIGIYGESSNRLLINNNDFNDNGFALRLLGSCADNVITRNNFIDNTFDVGTNATREHNNTYNGNYWSDYSGYDLDRDGYGDVPYRPVKLFSYVVERVPQAIVLLRSLFVDLMNFTEKVTPVFTPQTLFDGQPLMKPHPHDLNTTPI